MWQLLGKRLCALAIVFGPAGAVLVAVAAVEWTTPVSASTLLRDPAAVVGAPLYTGFVSHVGVLLWWTAAVVCVFSWAVLRWIGQRQPERGFLLVVGLLTAALALDDLFLFHEQIAPLHLGLSGTAVYSAYGATALVAFARFWRVIAASDLAPLLLSAVFFAGSVGIDVAHEAGLSFYGVGMAEDGCKLMGIAGWCGYLTRIAFAQFSGALLRDAAVAPSAAQSPGTAANWSLTGSRTR